MEKAKLRGIALTWWKSLQNERMARGLDKISNWERMKIMIRSQFLPSNLAIQMKMRRNNLKQRDMDIMSYTEQFHTLSIKGEVEDEDEKVAKYMSGLKFNIQDEIGLNIPRTLGECFQLAIGAEEKLKRKKERQNNRGGE